MQKDSAQAKLLVRFPADMLSGLKEEASSERVSVNSLIVRVLRRYLSWGRLQVKLGFMPLHKSMVAAMLEKLSEEEVEAIGATQKEQTIRDFLLFKSGLTLASFVDWIATRCEMLGFELVQKEENGLLRVMIYHSMGHKWSCYYRGLFLAVLKELLPEGDWKKVSPTTTDSLFGVQIPVWKSMHPDRGSV